MISGINEEKHREEVVRSLGVFELRGLAREMGITSPTTKKREELISLIFDKIKEGNTPEIKSNRRGRPHKQLSAINDIVNTITSKSVELDFEKVVSFMQENKPILNTLSSDSFILEGIVRGNEDDFNFIDKSLNQRVYLDLRLEGYNLLQVGCLVKVKAKQVNNGDMFSADEILEINGVSVKDYTISDFDKGQDIISDQSIPFASAFAKEGRRNVYCYSEDLYENKNFEQLNEFCKGKFKLIVLSINTSFENQIIFRSLGLENNFSTEYGTSNEINANKVIDVINYTNYLINRGEKVVVFIPDILEVLRKVDACFAEEKEESGYGQRAMLIIQKLLSMGRAYENGSSSTLIMGYNEIDKDEKFLNNDILKISKRLN